MLPQLASRNPGSIITDLLRFGCAVYQFFYGVTAIWVPHPKGETTFHAWPVVNAVGSNPGHTVRQSVSLPKAIVALRCE